MNHVRALLLPAAACLMAIATPALAQDASSGAHGQHPSRAAAPRICQVRHAVPATATAEVPDSNCRLEIFYVVGITQPNYTTMCGPR